MNNVQMQKAAGIAVVGGVPAAVAGARACGVCNIVCNSDSVFSSHLAGQKHASMLRKMAQTQTSISPFTSLQQLPPLPQQNEQSLFHLGSS